MATVPQHLFGKLIGDSWKCWFDGCEEGVFLQWERRVDPDFWACRPQPSVFARAVGTGKCHRCGRKIK